MAARATKTHTTVNGKKIPYKFPNLYSKNSRGKIREWTISVEEGEDSSKMTTTSGEIGGKYTNSVREIKVGKNIGKANETSHYQQALHQAQSKWQKKVDEGSIEDQEAAAGQVVVRPMLAQDYHKRAHDIVWPAYTQPKLDGVRAIVYLDSAGELVFESRAGKQYPHLAPQRAELKDSGILPLLQAGMYLDGELYNNDHEAITFQGITSICRRETLKEGDEDKMKLIQYHIFDYFDTSKPTLSFKKRYSKLEKLLLNEDKSDKYTYLKLVSAKKTKTEGKMKEYFSRFMADGYEGIMVRNAESPYELDKRSKHLQKYKEFMDAEYKIVGFEEATANDAGTVIWVCEFYNSKLEQNSTFNVRPRGTREQRREWFDHGAEHIGKLLTVVFQELTDYNCPRFPVGVGFRAMLKGKPM